MLRVFASAKTLHQLSPPSQSLESRLLLAFSLVEVVLQISPVFLAIIVVLTLPTLYSFFIELLTLSNPVYCVLAICSFCLFGFQ